MGSESDSWYLFLGGLACLPLAVAAYILAFRAGTRWHIWLLVVAATLSLCTFTWWFHCLGHALGGGEDVPSWWLPHLPIALMVSFFVCLRLFHHEDRTAARKRHSGGR